MYIVESAFMNDQVNDEHVKHGTVAADSYLANYSYVITEYEYQCWHVDILFDQQCDQLWILF